VNTDTGFTPAATGLATAISLPVVASILKIETLFDPKLAEYKKCPVGSAFTDVGVDPVAVVSINVRSPVV
jgi:hypothetical protein